MSNLPKPVQDLIDGICGDLSLKNNPKKAALVAEIVNDSLVVGSSLTLGKDMSKELKVIEATLLNLADHERQVVVVRVLNFIQTSVTTAITGALLAL